MVNYRMSKEAANILDQCPSEVKRLMTLCLERYFKTGEEYHFTHDELKDFWFYLKVHELADRIQRYSDYAGWYGSFEHLELQNVLSRNCTKFINKRFRVGGYR